MLVLLICQRIKRDLLMKRGNWRLQWTVLTLAIILSLLLVSLDIFVFQPTSTAKNARIAKTIPLGNLIVREQAAASTGIVKIMPLGDSITYGQGSTTGGGYRWPLWNDLRAQGVRMTFVGSMQHGPVDFPRDNEGLPGWKIDQIAAHVTGWLETYQPQIILLHIGTNDFIKHDDPVGAPARLKSLIDLVTATLPTAILIVAQIIPLTRRPQFNAEVVKYNQAIPGIVQAEASQGRHVLYVDMYHAVSPSLLLNDGAHPSDRGYILMAQVWERALIPLFKP